MRGRAPGASIAAHDTPPIAALEPRSASHTIARMADLFISHSSMDVEWTRDLRRQLESAGYSCWMAPDDVQGPTPWAEQILEAIEACRVMIVVVSRHANASAHVSKEVGAA